jgi:hypothetical protein
MMGLGGEVPGCVTAPTLPFGWVCHVRDSAHAVAGEVGMTDFWTSLYQPSARRTGGTPVGGCKGR